MSMIRRCCGSRTGCTCSTPAMTGTTWSSRRRRATASCATPAPRCSAAAPRTTHASPSGRPRRTSTSGRRAAARGGAAADCWPLIRRLETNDGPGDHHGRDGPVNIRTVPPEDPCGVAVLEAAAQAGLPTSRFNEGRTVTNGAGWFQINSSADNTRMSSSHAYLHPLIGKRPNLEIRTGCWVKRVAIDDGRASAVEYLTPDLLTQASVKARREVILSAGAIDTPKLLMLSGIGPGEHLQEFGIETLVDLARRRRQPRRPRRGDRPMGRQAADDPHTRPSGGRSACSRPPRRVSTGPT